MTVPSRVPRAFSGSRLGWADLPRTVRYRIALLADAEVISETSATSGFSPGYAAVLGLGDGTQIFVKAVSGAQNPDSPELARAEARVAAQLPAEVPAPRLLWSDDDGTWVLLGFAAVEGSSPHQPWLPDQLALVLDALTALAAASPAPPGLRPLSGDVAELAQGWRRLVADPVGLDRAVAVAGTHGPWLRDHLTDLVRWSDDAARACVGDSLVHGDLRADNVIIDADASGQVWLIDWPHAAGAGAPWFDLLAMLPSVAMQGGGDPDAIFWAHRNARGADRADVRAVLAALTGYFLHACVQDAPLGIANLRPFQTAQGVAALDWLRRL